MFDAIAGSSSLVRTGAWYTLMDSNGEPLGSKFQATKWTDRMVDEAFRARVYEIMDEEVIYKFDKREGSAADFYEEDE